MRPQCQLPQGHRQKLWQGGEGQGRRVVHLRGRKWVDEGGREGADVQDGVPQPQLDPQRALGLLAMARWRQAQRVGLGHHQSLSPLGHLRQLPRRASTGTPAQTPQVGGADGDQVMPVSAWIGP